MVAMANILKRPLEYSVEINTWSYICVLRQKCGNGFFRLSAHLSGRIPTDLGDTFHVIVIYSILFVT